MIQDRDLNLLTSFIKREADDFRFQRANGKVEYVQRMVDKILSYSGSPISKCNFIVIHSLTNMGLTERKLYLTPRNWVSGNVNTQVFLPPSPKGGFTPVHVIKR